MTPKSTRKDEKAQRIEKELRDLWDDYGGIMDDVLKAANEIQKYDDVTERNKRSISTLAFSFSLIVDKLDEIVLSLNTKEERK